MLVRKNVPQGMSTLATPTGLTRRVGSHWFAALSFTDAVAVMTDPTSKGVVQSQGSGPLPASRVVAMAVAARPSMADAGMCSVPSTSRGPLTSPPTYASVYTVATAGGVNTTGPAVRKVLKTSIVVLV